ncbi:MAG: HK97 family phage prohead protease [Alphaproteobacteria bacterium]
MTVRHFTTPLEIKNYGADGLFYGYASVFNKIDSHDEAVAPGAFRRTLANWRAEARMPAMLWMHDATLPVGVWLGLTEDKEGLAVEGRLALRTQRGSEAYELLKMGAVTGLSIGYRVAAARADARRKLRTLLDIDLFEISLVTFPANDAARVTRVKTPLPVSGNATRAIVAPLYRAAEALRTHI